MREQQQQDKNAVELFQENVERWLISRRPNTSIDFKGLLRLEMLIARAVSFFQYEIIQIIRGTLCMRFFDVLKSDF